MDIIYINIIDIHDMYSIHDCTLQCIYIIFSLIFIKENLNYIHFIRICCQKSFSD